MANLDVRSIDYGVVELGVSMVLNVGRVLGLNTVVLILHIGIDFDESWDDLMSGG